MEVTVTTAYGNWGHDIPWNHGFHIMRQRKGDNQTLYINMSRPKIFNGQASQAGFSFLGLDGGTSLTCEGRRGVVVDDMLQM